MRFGRILYGTDTTNSVQIQAERWGAQILQANFANAANLHSAGASLIYRYATAVYRPGDNQGITQCVLPSTVQPSWFLLSSTGAQITRSSNGDVALDPGNPAFQQAAVLYLAAQLTAGQFDGVMLDEINEVFSYGGWSASPTKYPTPQSWQAALTSFVTALAAGLIPLGFKVTMNLACVNSIPWGKSLVAWTGRCLTEFWMAGNGVSQWRGTQWLNASSWAGWLEQENHEGWFNVNTTDPVVAGYGLASYLLISEGAGVLSAVSDYGNASDIWTEDFDAARQLGPARGWWRQQGASFSRSFANGQVEVNPTTGTYSITV